MQAQPGAAHWTPPPPRQAPPPQEQAPGPPRGGSASHLRQGTEVCTKAPWSSQGPRPGSHRGASGQACSTPHGHVGLGAPCVLRGQAETAAATRAGCHPALRTNAGTLAEALPARPSCAPGVGVTSRPLRPRHMHQCPALTEPQRPTGSQPEETAPEPTGGCRPPGRGHGDSGPPVTSGAQAGNELGSTPRAPRPRVEHLL